MAAKNNAMFQVYENVGLDPAELVPSKAGGARIMENIGLDPAELVPSKVGSARINENIGINANEQTMQVTQYPVGWGISPRPRGVTSVPPPEAEFQTYEYIT